MDNIVEHVEFMAVLSFGIRRRIGGHLVVHDRDVRVDENGGRETEKANTSFQVKAIAGSTV